MMENVLCCIQRKDVIEVLRMANCPNCGNDVQNAKKTWKMAGRPDKNGKRTQLTIGLYECCGKSFRKVLDKKKI